MNVVLGHARLRAVYYRFEWAWNQDWLMALGLFFSGLVSRLPFQSQALYHWDSVNFAFSLYEFNLAKEQPHPPGYILYVFFAKLINFWVGDPQRTLVGISIMASALSAPLIFQLGKEMFNRRVGCSAALFLLFSPLFWFYGEIALPHTLDLLLTTLIVFGFCRVMNGQYRALIPTVIVASVAGGVRQQTLIFLAPLILVAMWGQPWRRWLMAAGVGFLVCLAWLIPLVMFNGGLTNYLAIMNAFSARFQTTTNVLAGAGWFGLTRNLTKLGLYTAYAWNLFLLPVIAAAVLLFKRKTLVLNWKNIIFFTAWIFPAGFYYLLIHMGQQGLVFIFLPALLLISGWSVDTLVKSRGWLYPAMNIILVAGCAGLFLFLPEYPLGQNGQRFLTIDTIRNHDRYILTRVRYIRENFPADRTFILSSNWHHLEYYLPEYPMLPFTIVAKRELEEGAAASPESEKFRGTPGDLGVKSSLDEVNWVVFDPELRAFNRSQGDFIVYEIEPGIDVDVARLGPEDLIDVGGGGYSLVRKGNSR